MSALAQESVKPRFLRIEQVLEQVPVCKATIYRRVKKGDFPSPVQFGGTSLWLESEVNQWMNSLVQAR